MTADVLLGQALLGVSTLCFLYYSFWVLVLPFVDDDQPLHALFPPRHFAVVLPAYAILVRGSLRRRCRQERAAGERLSLCVSGADSGSLCVQVVVAAVMAFVGKELLLGGTPKKQVGTRHA